MRGSFYFNGSNDSLVKIIGFEMTHNYVLANCVGPNHHDRVCVCIVIFFLSLLEICISPHWRD